MLKKIFLFIKTVFKGFIFVFKNPFILFLVLLPIILCALVWWLWFEKIIFPAQPFYLPTFLNNQPFLIKKYSLPAFSLFILTLNYFLALLCRYFNRLVIYYLLGTALLVQFLMLVLVINYIV